MGVMRVKGDFGVKRTKGVEGSPGVINPCIFTEGKLCYERSDEFQYKGV